MDKPSLSAQTSIDLLLISIFEIVRYSVQKKRYECALIVQEQMSKVRQAAFCANANECAVVTRQLQLYKTKLKLLELEIEKYPEDTREVWKPLVNELNNKINVTRQIRLKLS